MSETLTVLAEWVLSVAALLIGLLLAHYIYFSYKFSNAEGYLWPAVWKIKTFLLAVLAVQLLIAVVLSFPVFYWASLPVKLLWALGVGVLAAGFPYYLEKLLLPVQNPLRKLERPLTQAFLRYNLAVRHRLAETIATCREHDVFDCQKDGWGTGLEPAEVGRRLRIIYELKKIDIARARRDPGFLRFDESRNPWEKFYLLARHMSRSELRQCIINPPPPPRPGWNGKEDRRRKGSKADRKQPDPNPNRSRCYDYPELIKRIKKGERELPGLLN